MADTVAPQVFTRRASGLVRVMSPYSAFIYSVLTMGIIFPWVYLEAPTAFQGSNLVLGILFGFLFELPIALAYVWLATALPRSGGDYLFQSRVFGGGVGFTVVFAFFVLWILRVGGPVRVGAGHARDRADVHRPRRHHQRPCLHHDRDVGRHGERHHHHQPRERGDRSGPAGYGLQELGGSSTSCGTPS